MNDKAEKVYGDAFFSLCCEENEAGLKDYLNELTELSKVFSDNPEFIKLMSTPTVTLDEKKAFLEEMQKSGNISALTGNLLGVLAEKGRMNCFAGIAKRFRELYNDKFKLAEITVTSSVPLSDKMKNEIAQKMSKVIGKTVTINEKVNPSIIGGVIIDYGSRRYDGSVKARLNELSKELGSVIA
ncbi:MAG: F0F1 ATP synthase subunit delta [Oscillospiraceae bacterium]|nr:F0F1 ATP synthase subunit delta [Oscillospiraceae bacterium]